MKKFILLFFLFFVLRDTKGQNLVPNGDFEQYSGCPYSYSQLNLTLFWMNPSTLGSPDYYNQCDTSNAVSVPINIYSLGYQFAHSGGAYSGIFLTGYSLANVREFIEVSLLSPLITNACYHFEMYVNISNFCKYSTDDFGVYFSDTAITGISNWNPLPFIPQIENTPGNFPDTLNWTLINGNFTANGGESYIIIGNFKDSVSTNVVLINSNGSEAAYIYIDDVSITPCTGINGQGAGSSVTKDSFGEFRVYPNPVKDELNITSKNRIEEIKISDMLGKQVYRNQLTTSPEGMPSAQLPTSNYLPGIYFVEVNDGKNVFRKKFVKE